MKLYIHRKLKFTQAEGPGVRYCLWVQGCSRCCPGCMAQHTWHKEDGKLIDTEEVIADLKEIEGQIEGITFLGGEPFEQPEALSEIASAAKALGLSVITFTGWTIEELRQQGEAAGRLLAVTDLLIDGPYIDKQRDLSRPWVGSKNQRYHDLTGRYTEETILQEQNRIEVRLQKDGTVLLNGMGDFDAVLNMIEQKEKTDEPL